MMKQIGWMRIWPVCVNLRGHLIAGFALGVSSMPMVLAEPGQIQKDALMDAVAVRIGPRDGVWLKWACGEYAARFGSSSEAPIKDEDTRQALGAGLCAGFLIALFQVNYPNRDVFPKLDRLPFDILKYLDLHPEVLGMDATVLARTVAGKN